MKAAVLHAANQPLTIEEVALTKPGPREVLLRTAFAGLCHSDLHFIEGLYPHPTPCVLGHESAGVVEAVGEGVTYVKPGDHVITCLSVFCGTCPQCVTGHPNLCENTEVKLPPGVSRRLSWKNGELMNQFLNLSSFGEQMLVHENSMVKIDPDIPLDRAALVGCGVMTGVGAVFNAAKVEPGVLRKEPFPSPYTGRLVCGLPGFQRFDSLAVEASGNIAVATLITGYITVISPDGRVVRQVKMPDVYPTNICFGGPDMKTAYITLSAGGELAAMDWPEPGLRLNFQE